MYLNCGCTFTKESTIVEVAGYNVVSAEQYTSHCSSKGCKIHIRHIICAALRGSEAIYHVNSQ